MTSKYKLAIVVRTDLDMGKGKLCVQAGHASVLAYDGLMKHDFEVASVATEWLEEGQLKIVLKVSSLPETYRLLKGWLWLARFRFTWWRIHRKMDDVYVPLSTMVQEP
jgi:peptidyl-tRNA hydrolase